MSDAPLHHVIQWSVKLLTRLFGSTQSCMKHP